MSQEKSLFGQVLVALVTPMNAEGEVDWDATEKHIEAAFAKANILYDNDGLRLFLIKELGTLSLL